MNENILFLRLSSNRCFLGILLSSSKLWSLWITLAFSMHLATNFSRVFEDCQANIIGLETVEAMFNRGIVKRYRLFDWIAMQYS